jgi:ankyrin repeat protein
LQIAVLCRHEQIAHTLVKKVSYLSREDLNYEPPLLHLAVGNRLPAALLSQLIKAGGNVDASDASGRTALCVASRNGDADAMRVMLDAGGSFQPDNEGETLLHALVRSWSRNLGAVDLLLGRGADIDAKSDLNYTPLHIATLAEHQEYAIYLVQKGANVNAEDKGGYCPLHFAAKRGNLTTTEMLMKRVQTSHCAINSARHHKGWSNATSQRFQNGQVSSGAFSMATYEVEGGISSGSDIYSLRMSVPEPLILFSASLNSFEQQK